MKTLWPRVALFAFGVAMVLQVALGYVYRFVQPIYAWPILISGIILMVLAWRMPVVGKPLPAVTWLMLVPICVATAVVPGPLALDVKPRRVSAGTQAQLEPFQPGMNETTVLDLIERKPEVGVQVKFVGMVWPDDEGWEVVRYRMICCAADAIPYGVRINGPMPKSQWVAVEGVVASVDPVRIEPSNVTPVSEPERPYL